MMSSETNTDNRDTQNLGPSAMIVSAGTLLSRIFGLIRDMSIAFVFGASRVTDVFFIAYQIPSIFRKLLGEGALSSTLVPVYVDLRSNGSPEDADRLGSAMFTWTILTSTVIVGICILFAEYLVMAIAPGFVSTQYLSLTVTLTRLMFPFLILMSSASVVMGILHARKVYAPSAFAPVCFNLVLISAVWFLVPYMGVTPTLQIRALVVGVLLGGFLQFFVQWISLKPFGISLYWNPDWNAPGLTRVLTMMGPMVFGLAVTQLIAFFDKIIASFLDAGNISHLYYSNRLFQFPFALIAIALGTVVLPESSQQVSDSKLGEVGKTARDAIGMMTFLMLPATAGLALIGDPLIGLLFRRREFTVVDQKITFAVLFFALFGLVAYGFIRILVSLCYSFEDTIGPAYAACIALVVNVILDVIFVLIWPSTVFRVCGLTLAGSFAVWIQVMVLRFRLDRHLPDEKLIPRGKLIRHLLLTLGMVVVIGPLVIMNWPAWMQVIFITPIGALFYLLTAYLIGDPYPKKLIGKI